MQITNLGTVAGCHAFTDGGGRSTRFIHCFNAHPVVCVVGAPPSGMGIWSSRGAYARGEMDVPRADLAAQASFVRV